METSQLSPEEFRQFHSAAQVLSKFKGVKLDQAVMEYAEAKRALNGDNLIQAAQFFARYGADKIRTVSVPNAVKELVASLETAKLGSYHIDTTRERSAEFATAFPNYISDVTTAEIEAWLDELGADERTRNNYKATVVQLFNFAQKN